MITRNSLLLRRLVIVALIASGMFAAKPGLALDDSELDPLTKDAVAACKSGKLQDAVDLEEKVIKEKPKAWLPRAMASYFYWLQGNVIDAVTEGQKAVRFSPSNKIALINLAHIFQSLRTYPDAIPLYDEARKLGGGDWVPWLGLAGCYFETGQDEQGLAILREMSKQSNGNFAWYYKLGDAYLMAGKPDLAIEPLSRARDMASTAEEKSECATALFVALAAANQPERAKALEDQVLKQNHPTDSEPYVRAVAALVPASDPAYGKEILQLAVSNLTATKDSDGFFKIGRLFEDKAANANLDSSKRLAWLEIAATAFNQAIDLNPGESRLFLGLAGALASEGKIREMTKELDKARTLDSFDPLIPFLTERVKEEQKLPVNLAAVRFQIKGLTCSCHVGRVESALSEMKGAALLYISHLNPYEGTMVVDPSQIAVNDVFTQIREKGFEPIKEVTKDVKFEVLSQQPVTSVEQTIRMAQDARYGDALKFIRQFPVFQPVLPVTLVADHSGSAS